MLALKTCGIFLEELGERTENLSENSEKLKWRGHFHISEPIFERNTHIMN